ncbi:MAG TPA: iron ABC transporter permease [Gemmatimonadaceae bacterium]|nr:iron ABC transporter permease [Gemmatimonadaceae bacterium]
MISHRAWHWPLLIVVLIGLCIIAIGTGAIAIPARDVLSAIAGNGEESVVSIVRNLRLPRVLLAAFVGAGLGMSGGALQGTLRNGLAEPYLLGVSGGAAVGAVIAFSVGAIAEGVVALAAFGGAASAVILALLVARAAGRGGRGDPRTLLMAGVVIGAFANAVIMIALANAPPNTIRGALWWMMGSVADASWRGVGWLAAYVTVGGSALVLWAREIDILALGEEPAAALGVNVEKAARRIFLLSALLAGATVAAAGLIGFVGLIVPHIVRASGIRHHRPLLVASALVGATLVVAADLIARTMRPPGELPLGAVTAVLGVPFFLAQLRRAA